MNQFTSWEVSTKANKWQGRNITRWQNADYDTIYRAAQSEVDPVKRAAMFMQLNDLAVNDHVVIPVVARPITGGKSNKLTAPISGWDNTTWLISDWYREG